MSVFGDYASCYDLIYRNKDYEQEVAFVAELIEQRMPEAHSVLELGCGTGGHAAPLAERGFRVAGVDRSAEMLRQAERRLGALPAPIRQLIDLTESDIASLQITRRFDAALAFFHVVSYLTSDELLRKSFANIRRHLVHGGLLIFDFWYGPAVVAQLPERRVRTFEDETRVVVRTMQPTLLSHCHCVLVDIQLRVTNKRTSDVQYIEEQHLLRYFDQQDLSQFLQSAGFSVRRTSAWLSDAPATEADWSACLVAEAV